MMETTTETERTHRRYREGEYYYYDQRYDSEESRSAILNGNFQEGELHSLLESRKSRLVMMENDLEDLLASQKLSKQAAWNRGEKWMEDVRVREKRITLAARIDVCKLEIDTLEEAIQEAAQEAEEEAKKILPCLPNGPAGSNSVPASVGRGFVDGQWCDHLGNVGLVIFDERSRYRGMRVEDYLEHVARPWVIASQEYKSKCKKEGKPVPAGGGRGSRFVPWPKWPACVKNYLKKEPSFRRTKFSTRL